MGRYPLAGMAVISLSCELSPRFLIRSEIAATAFARQQSSAACAPIPRASARHLHHTVSPTDLVIVLQSATSGRWPVQTYELAPFDLASRNRATQVVPGAFAPCSTEASRRRDTARRR